MFDEVLTEHPEGDSVVGLNTTVATTYTVAAHHDEISPYIVPGMFADVVEG